jgi:hypothetical protein
VTRISDSIEETVAQLERLHEPIRARHGRDFEALQAIVAGLGDPFDASLADESAPDLGRAGPGRPPRQVREPERPNPLDPDTTTRDPVLRGRLIAEVLDHPAKW